MRDETDAGDKNATTAGSGDDTRPDAEGCRTSPLVPNFSICLLKSRHCSHALSFGHQYLCRHPEHAKFASGAGKD